MQPMRLCICSGRQFEKTFENSHWRKVLQMQLMRLCICSGRQFEKTSENSHWGKVLQMQLTFVKTRNWISFPNPTFPMPKRFKYSQATNICGNHVVNAISKNQSLFETTFLSYPFLCSMMTIFFSRSLDLICISRKNA